MVNLNSNLSKQTSDYIKYKWIKALRNKKIVRKNRKVCKIHKKNIKH